MIVKRSSSEDLERLQNEEDFPTKSKQWLDCNIISLRLCLFLIWKVAWRRKCVIISTKMGKQWLHLISVILTISTVLSFRTTGDTRSFHSTPDWRECWTSGKMGLSTSWGSYLEISNSGKYVAGRMKKKKIATRESLNHWNLIKEIFTL